MQQPDLEKDYYSILGAARTASQDEIERLYKRLARLHHPDRGGNAEEMKTINEAYHVLRSPDTRRSYDSSRQSDYEAPIMVTPPLSQSSAFLPDSVSGRLATSFLFLLVALVFLFLVRIYYIRFMWPVFILAVCLVFSGVWKVHKVMVLARTSPGASHPVWRYVWLQEIIFWSMVCAGAYGIYLLLHAM